MPRILIVDDEPEMLRGLEDNLQFEGYQTVTAGDGKKGLALALSEAPDLILLDVMMPGMSGWDLCRELRQRGLDVPVIMLTARGEEVDRVLGLELGADDYVTKPFSLRELMARIRAVLRRPGPRQKFEEFAFGTVRVHLRARQAFKAGQEVRLTPLEYRLLACLVKNAGKVVTQRQLLKEVWGPGSVTQSHYLRVYMSQLRGKLEAEPARPLWLITEPGVGYRLAAADEAKPPMR